MSMEGVRDMTGERKSTRGRTPLSLFAALLVMAAAAAAAVWRAHPNDGRELLDIVLAALMLEVAGLIVVLPIGLLTGVYQKRPADYGSPRRRPFGLVAVLIAGATFGLYLLTNNLAWLPVFAPRELWRFAPWDPHWNDYWAKQRAGTALYAGFLLGSAGLQLLWDRWDHHHWRKIAEARPRPLTLDGV